MKYLIDFPFVNHTHWFRVYLTSSFDTELYLTKNKIIILWGNLVLKGRRSLGDLQWEWAGVVSVGISITWVESWGNPSGSCEGGKCRQELQERNPLQRHHTQGLILTVMGSQVSPETLIYGEKMLLQLEFGSRRKGFRSPCITLPWGRHVLMSSKALVQDENSKRAKSGAILTSLEFEIWEERNLRVYQMETELVCGKCSFILNLPSRYFKWQTIKSNMKTVELSETHEKRPDHCSSKQLIRRAILLYCPQEYLRLSGAGGRGGGEGSTGRKCT